MRDRNRHLLEWWQCRLPRVAVHDMEGRYSSHRAWTVRSQLPVAAEDAEHTEASGSRLKSAPPRLCLVDGPGESGPHGQEWETIQV